MPSDRLALFLFLSQSGREGARVLMVSDTICNTFWRIYKHILALELLLLDRLGQSKEIRDPARVVWYRTPVLLVIVAQTRIVGPSPRKYLERGYHSSVGMLTEVDYQEELRQQKCPGFLPRRLLVAGVFLAISRSNRSRRALCLKLRVVGGVRRLGLFQSQSGPSRRAVVEISS